MNGLKKEPDLCNEPMYPLYQIIMNGDEYWLTLDEARKTYYNGLFFVIIGGLVLESVGAKREITDEERRQISSSAGKYRAMEDQKE